jgi:PAS domain S-box-containing protein
MDTAAITLTNSGQEIADREKDQELLQVSETRYRRLFETAQDGILILDAETGQIMDVNPFLIDLLGFSYEQFLGKKIWEIGLFKDIVANKENFEELQRKEFIRYEDMPIVTADGRRIAVEFVSNVYTVDHARVIQCNIRDNTERKRAEEAQVASEIRYRRLFETAQDGILILDADTGQIVEVNPFLINMLGFSRDQFLGKKIWEIGLFRDIVANKDNFEELQRKEFIRYEDMPIETADGRLIAVEFLSNVYTVNNKKVIQCNIRDITKRKLAEEERAHLAAAVEYSEDAIISKTPDGKISRWNNGAERIYGYSAQEMVGKNISLLVPPDVSDDTPVIIERLRNGEKIIHYETLRRKKDGGLINIALTASPVRDAQNSLIGVSTIAHDITWRKIAEETLGASEIRYRRLFETAQDGILILDADTGQIVEVNPFLINMLGFSRDQFLGKKIWEIGLFKDIVANKENFEELQRKEFIRYEDMPIETADGQRIAVEFVSNVYEVNNKKVIQCNIRNNTERKLAEEAQVASEIRYRRLFETAQDGILILDADTGQIVEVNPFLINMLGFSRDQFLGKKSGRSGCSRTLLPTKTTSKNYSGRNISGTKICRSKPLMGSGLPSSSSVTSTR